MKTLPQQFRKNGFNHDVVERFENIVLIRKSQGDWVGWEVARVFFAEAREIAGHAIEAGEHLPSSEQWGTYGFSYTTEAKARERYDKMVIAEVMK